MRRVVVTGLGAVTPIGNNVEEFWNGIKAGKCGIDKVTLFDATDFKTQIAGEVKNFEPTDFIEKKDARKMDRYTQLAMVAADEAVKDSGLNMEDEDPWKVGVICSVSEICCGMAKMNLLPAFFQKKNKNGAPYWVIIILGVLTCIIEASGISTGEQVAFLTLTCSLFWMLSYITSHVNVIMLRRKMKNVPRNFKTPLFPLLQIVGIALQVYMMFNISTDPVQRRNIYILCFVLFAALFIYAFIWVKYRLKLPLLKGIGVHQVMMMESPEYHRVHSDLKNESNTNMGT